MSFEDDSSAVELDPIRVEGDLIAVDRTLVARESGIVATLRIGSHVDSAVKYQLIDPFPSAFDIDEIGFHPDYQPSHGRIDDNQIVLGGVVEPNDEQLVRYGVCPYQAKSPEEIDEIQRNQPPVIDLEECVDENAIDEVDLETPALARGTRTADHSSRGLFSSFKRSVLGETAGNDSEAWGPTEEPSTETTASEEAAEAVAEAISDLEGVDETDAAAADPETVEDLFEQAEGGEGSGADATATPTRADKPVVELLIDDLRGESISPERRQALAEELAALLETQEHTLPRSAAVRLRELESKMAEFSAYREGLRDLIDEHGTAAEFVTEIKSSIDSLETAIEDLQGDLESTSEQVDALEGKQDDLADDLENLESSLEDLADDSAAEREDLADDIDSLEDSLDVFRRSLDDTRSELAEDVDNLSVSIEEVEADLETLRGDVEEGKARRRAIAKALSGDQIDDE